MVVKMRILKKKFFLAWKHFLEVNLSINGSVISTTSPFAWSFYGDLKSTLLYCWKRSVTEVLLFASVRHRECNYSENKVFKLCFLQFSSFVWNDSMTIIHNIGFDSNVSRFAITTELMERILVISGVWSFFNWKTKFSVQHKELHPVSKMESIRNPKWLAKKNIFDCD